MYQTDGPFRRLMTIAAITLLALTPSAALASASTDEDAVKAVLSDYKQALERLDGEAPAKLFAPDAEIFESGKREGSYKDYLVHHLGPELVEFSSFRFDNYSAVVRIEGDVAITSESYTYRIVLKRGGEPIERTGVATSVLKRTAGGWRFLQAHSSSRRPPAPNPVTPK